MGQRHPPSGVLETAAGASDSHNGEKLDVLERPRTETDVVEPWIAVDGRRRADLSLGGSGSSPVSVEVACPGQAGALKGKAGGKTQRGNMSASSRKRKLWHCPREKKTLALPARDGSDSASRKRKLWHCPREKKTLALPAPGPRGMARTAPPGKENSGTARGKRKLWHCPRHAPAARNSRSALAGCVLAAAARIVSPSPTVSMFPIAVGAKATRCASKEPSGKSTARWPITHSARAAPAPASETPSAQVGRATAGKQPVAR